MTLRSLAVVLLLATGWATPAGGSQELVVPWSSFTIVSRALPSGVVEVAGLQSENGLSKLVVKAFGRQFELSPAELRALVGMTANGMQLTYEYAGSPVLYLLFQNGRVEQRVTVSEHTGVQVGRRTSIARASKPVP